MASLYKVTDWTPSNCLTCYHNEYWHTATGCGINGCHCKKYRDTSMLSRLVKADQFVTPKDWELIITVWKITEETAEYSTDVSAHFRQYSPRDWRLVRYDEELEWLSDLTFDDIGIEIHKRKLEHHWKEV